MHRRITVVLLLTAALAACESPFRDEADRAAYPLIDQRQREVLGTTSQTAIGGVTTSSDRAGKGDYSKIPLTTNALPPGYDTPAARAALGSTPPATSSSSPAPAAATAATPATGPATQPLVPETPTMSNSVESLMRKLPGIDLEKMPDLPPFPRPAPVGKTRIVFSLDDCFNYALTSSRDYKTHKEDLYIAALDVTLQRHQFEPTLFAQTASSVIGQGENSDYATAFNATQSVGVNQKLPYGGEVVATALASTVNQLRQVVAESTSAQIVLQANIPLLRGAGMVAQENLISSERSLIYTVRDFERFRRAFLVNVASSYFSLVNQRAQIINRYRSVNSYIFITERSQALFKAGKQSLLDVQRAAQQELQARNDLINSLESYESSLDNFKLLMGMPTDQTLDVAPQYLNIAPPDVQEKVAIGVADQLRLDLQTMRDRVADARRQVAVATNNLLPDLEFSAQSTNASDGQRSLTPRFDNLNYSAGVTLDWPLDRVSERNSYRVSLINLDRAKRNVDTAADQVAVDVRSALRRVTQQKYLLAIQNNNIELAQKRKEFSDIQFRNGKIDNRDYLDAESALLDAQNRFAQAVSDLQVVTLQYLRDTDQLRVDNAGHLLMPAIAAEPATQPATQPTPPPATQP